MPHRCIDETRSEIRTAYRQLHRTPASMAEVNLMKKALLRGATEFKRGFQEGYLFALEQQRKPDGPKKAGP